MLFRVCKYRRARSIACEFVLCCALSIPCELVLYTARSIYEGLGLIDARSIACEVGLPVDSYLRISEALVED